MNPRDLPMPPTPEGIAPGADDDSLVRAVQWTCRHHGVDRTALSLMEGLPTDGSMTPDLAVRTLRENGFEARLVRRRPRRLNRALLPAILLLTDGRGCTLTRRVDGGFGQPPRFEVVGPEQDVPMVIGETELMDAYTGYCLLVRPVGRVDTRGGHAPDDARGWLWKTLWLYRRYYRDALLASLLINVLTVASGLFAMHVYDRVIPHQAYATLWSLAIGAVAAMLFEATARHVRTYLLDLAGKKADVVLASALFRHTMGLRLEHVPDSAGTLAHQLREFETVRDFGASATLAVLSDLPFVLLFVAMVFLVGGPLGWVPLLSIPAVMLVSVAVQWPLRRLMRNNLRESAQLNGVLIESLEGLETLRATGSAGFVQKRYEDHNAATAMSGMRARALSNGVTNFVQMAQQAVTVLMLVWGTYLIHDGLVTAGALVGAVMFANRAIAPLAQFTGLAGRYQGARAALAALDQLMQLPAEREQGRDYVSRPRLAGGLAMQDAHFAYGSQQHHGAPPALRGLTVKINPGERVAIVGRIGSGKSTALKLLGGLYRPTQGQVHVDGIDMRQVDPADLRSHIGFVPQDVRLFHGTLRENVMMGRPNASWDAFLSAARLTGLDRMAAAHPLGWDLPIGELGAGLSGGQRQLVALARALVTRPRVLLLDEPTSAMDMQTEAIFVQKLQSIVQQRTVVIVTHRPSLLPLVDRMIVVDEGRIMADGPKDQVLELLAGRLPAAAEAAEAA